MGVALAGLMFPALFGMIFLGFPVAFALIATAMAFGYGIFGDAFGYQLWGRVIDIAGNFTLIQIPLFVFMGAIFESSSISTRLFHAMRVCIGPHAGGLSQAVIIMCAIFSASSGTVGACEIVVGLMAIPAMLEAGYKKDLISGTICGGGSLGTIIPPSVTVVVYATIADISMGDLIAGTVIPGLINTAFFMLYIYIRCKMHPEDGPPLTDPELLNMPLGQKLWLLSTALLPCVLLIFAVLGTIFVGIASPTESAAVGALGALLLVIAYGDFKWDVVIEGFRRTVLVSAMAMALILGGTIFTSIFMVNGGHTAIREAIQFLELGPTSTVFVFLLVIFLLGFILEWISILLIAVPIFNSVVIQLGIDPLWFAVLALTVLQTSYLSPPMGPSIFYLRSIAPKEISYLDMYRGVTPFVIGIILTGVVVYFVPWTATWLPLVLFRL
jgi:tripartite ATP-independent transporter DctM subunit